MGFFSSITTNLAGILGSFNQSELKDNITYQKYVNDIHKFDITPTEENLIDMDKIPKVVRTMEEMHNELDNIETLDDVKAYFEQQENKG